MRICFKPYKKKNNEIILYINNDRKVSVAIDSNGFPAARNTTSGQQKLIDAAYMFMKYQAPVFTGDLSKHTEGGYCAVLKLGSYVHAGTDVANIGGMNVGSDGSYVLREIDGVMKIQQCGEWVQVEELELEEEKS